MLRPVADRADRALARWGAVKGAPVDRISASARPENVAETSRGPARKIRRNATIVDQQFFRPWKRRRSPAAFLPRTGTFIGTGRLDHFEIADANAVHVVEASLGKAVVRCN